MISGSFRHPDPVVLDDAEARGQLISGLHPGPAGAGWGRGRPFAQSAGAGVEPNRGGGLEFGPGFEPGRPGVAPGRCSFKKVGVFPLDTFYPAQQRLELAMQFNSLLASTGFAAWAGGQALEDPAVLAQSSSGKVPVNLFYIAHLSESERMFFVSQLLSRLLAEDPQPVRKFSVAGSALFRRSCGLHATIRPIPPPRAPC